MLMYEADIALSEFNRCSPGKLVRAMKLYELSLGGSAKVGAIIHGRLAHLE